MFCEKCGNQLVPGSAFCEKCGAPVGNGNANTKAGGVAESFSASAITAQTSSKSVFYYGSLLTSVVMIILPLIQPWIDVAKGMGYNVSFSLPGILDVLNVSESNLLVSGDVVPSEIVTAVWALFIAILVSLVLHVRGVYAKGAKQKSIVSVFASLIYCLMGVGAMIALPMNKVPSEAVSISGIVWVGIIVSVVNIICTLASAQEN